MTFGSLTSSFRRASSLAAFECGIDRGSLAALDRSAVLLGGKMGGGWNLLVESWGLMPHASPSLYLLSVT